MNLKQIVLELKNPLIVNVRKKSVLFIHLPTGPDGLFFLKNDCLTTEYFKKRAEMLGGFPQRIQMTFHFEIKYIRKESDCL